MNAGLVALDPTLKRNHNLERFFRLLNLYKSRRIFLRTSIASIVQPSLYAVPYAAYRNMKSRLVKEADHRIRLACQGYLDLDPIHVLASDSSANESHVNQLARYANRIHAGALVLASNDHSGLPYWFLGSFSETAALTAHIPVFIIKPSLDEADLSRDVRFVLAIDVSSPPTANEVRWIANLGKPANAHIDLIYVVPRKRPLIDALQRRKSQDEAMKVLGKLEASFRSNKVPVRKMVLQESKSVAHAIADYAEETKAWLTITTAPVRSSAQKLFLGSTARKVLSLTKRPFLSLRLH